MDDKKIFWYAAIVVVVLGVVFVWPDAVRADAPPNNGLHVNSAGIESGQLPAPLPAVPGVVDMPDLTLPYADSSAWPTTKTTRDAIRADVEGRLTVLRLSLGRQYNRVRNLSESVNATTDSLVAAVGNPTVIVSEVDGQAVTVAAMAQQMSASIEYSIAYMRAVSSLGPLGLDLVFVFLGLGWIVFVNVADMGVRAIAWVLRGIASALGLLFEALKFIISVVHMIADVLDLFIPG